MSHSSRAVPVITINPTSILLSLCIYIPSSLCTIQYNLTSVTSTFSLQSPLAKVKPSLELSFHFLCSYIPAGGYFSLWGESHPYWGLTDSRRATEGNKIRKPGRTSDTRTGYTLMYPNIHWETQKILISCRFIVKSTFFSASQREWLKYISMSCWVSGFWSDSHFCINIQIHYHPREMNNRSYFISLTILNIMNRLTTIPHPSPWILTTDRSPVGNGNVTLIHLFASQSLPNNFQYITSDPKMLFWKQARSDIHCR